MKAHWLDRDQAAIDIPTLLAEGIHYQALPVDPPGYQDAVDLLKTERGYVQQDEVALRPENPNLEAICAKFVDEHLHDDDEVRLVLEGEGIFDIRSGGDRWMRVRVEAGDLIVVPAGRFHRFYLTEAKTIRCVRLFKDASGWVPRYRGAAAATISTA